jgi:hypothetical protein
VGWTEITCRERDALFASRPLRPFSSHTDTTGEFGEPFIYTEWGDPTTEKPVLRDYRWPGPNDTADTRPCRHTQYSDECNCFPHGPEEPCTCDGCWACKGHEVGCTCDIAWDCEHHK